MKKGPSQASCRNPRIQFLTVSLKRIEIQILKNTGMKFYKAEHRV